MEEEIELPIRRQRGGVRPGAGRPKGRKTLVGLKKAVLDYTSPTELKNLVERAKKMAKTDKTVLMWYLEQVFGKAKAVNQAPQGGKTVNNIALFLDSLEKKQIGNGSTWNGDRFIDSGQSTGGVSAGSGFQIIGQEVEDTPPLPDNEQER